MGKGNNFEVTIGHNSGFYLISRKTMNPTSFLAFFQFYFLTPVLEEMSFFYGNRMDCFRECLFQLVPRS
jgi:hypothetical protein